MIGGLRTADEQHRAPVEAFAIEPVTASLDDEDMEEFEV